MQQLCHNFTQQQLLTFQQQINSFKDLQQRQHVQQQPSPNMIREHSINYLNDNYYPPILGGQWNSADVPSHFQSSWSCDTPPVDGYFMQAVRELMQQQQQPTVTKRRNFPSQFFESFSPPSQKSSRQQPTRLQQPTSLQQPTTTNYDFQHQSINDYNEDAFDMSELIDAIEEISQAILVSPVEEASLAVCENELFEPDDIKIECDVKILKIKDWIWWKYTQKSFSCGSSYHFAKFSPNHELQFSLQQQQSSSSYDFKTTSTDSVKEEDEENKISFAYNDFSDWLKMRNAKCLYRPTVKQRLEGRKNCRAYKRN